MNVKYAIFIEEQRKTATKHTHKKNKKQTKQNKQKKNTHTKKKRK